MKKLLKIQEALKAPKDQTNNFAGYKYRNVEDILEAAKPYLAKEGCTLTISDSLELIGDRYYIKATATITDGTESVSVSAYAREQATKRGLDEAQVTGGASSYARKYCLGGLFLVDNSSLDPDTEPDKKKSDGDGKNKSDQKSQSKKEDSDEKPEPKPPQKLATPEQLGQLTKVCNDYKLDRKLVAEMAGITNNRVPIEAYNKAMSIANSMIAEKEAKGEA